MGIYSEYSTVKKFVRFSIREIEELLTISLIFGFILSFRDWGAESFDYIVGAGNLLQAFLVVLFSMLVVLLVQKVLSARSGLTTTHKVWTAGLIGSLVIGLFSGGIALLFWSSSFSLERVRSLGSGQGVGLGHLAKIAGAGLLVHAILAASAALVVQMWAPYWAAKLMLFNLVYIAWNVLPLPQVVGSIIFLWSRVWYVFGLFAVISFALLGFAGLPSFILAFAVGLIGMIIFFYKVEHQLS